MLIYHRKSAKIPKMPSDLLVRVLFFTFHKEIGLDSLEAFTHQE